jgi:DNA-3-methyladenine glycosylase II
MAELNGESPTPFTEELARAERTLARRDPVLRELIRRHGGCKIRPHERYFETLVKAIVSQQLSTRAAETIFNRLCTLYNPRRSPLPANILVTTDETLRGVGLSFQKIGYLRDLATRVERRELRLNRLPELTDEEVIAALTGVKGIGVWTAQMFLIFSLGRLDVFPVGDLGIRKAIQNCYGLDSLPVAAEMEGVAVNGRWAPWRSVASWYLWRSLENGGQN